MGQWWEAFKFVNNTFAVEVAKMVQPDDVVWVHDYHSSLFPRLLGEEEKKNNAPRLTKKIFFLHISMANDSHKSIWCPFPEMQRMYIGYLSSYTDFLLGC